MSENEPKGTLSRMPSSELIGDSTRIPKPLSGVSFLNRARYRAYEKEFSSYLAMVRARNQVGEALTESARISVSFQQQLERIEHLPEIRKIEGLKILAELDAEIDKVSDRETERDLRRLKQRSDIADATANAILAEQRLETLQNPPQPTPEPEREPGPSASEQRAARLAQLRRDEAELIAAIKNGYASDEDMPEAERDLIERVKLRTADLIADLIESFA